MSIEKFLRTKMYLNIVNSIHDRESVQSAGVMFVPLSCSLIQFD